MSSFTTEEIHSMITAIRGDDKNARMHALSNLHVIAQALGPDRARSELIPFIIETTDHDVKALRKIAKGFGNLLKEVGGPEHVAVLTNALKFLCENEDDIVSKPAVSSLIKLGREFSEDQLQNSLVPMICELCDDAWYPLRCAGVRLLCEFYRGLSAENRNIFKMVLKKMAADQLVQVRRMMVQSLATTICISDELVGDAADVLKKLSNDESVAVMVEVVPCIVAVAPRDMALALEMSEKVFESSIWQARTVLIDSIPDIFKKDPATEFIHKVALLAGEQTHSVHVRAALARILGFVSKCGAFKDAAAFEQLVILLTNDIDQSVRKATATSAASLPKETAEKVLKILLTDEDFDIRIASLHSVASTGFAIESMSSCFADIMKLSGWRVKKGIAEMIPSIAKTMTADLFSRTIQGLVERLLNDDADEVRQAMVRSLPKLVELYGNSWLNQELQFVLDAAALSMDYQIRKTSIYAIISLGLMLEMEESVTALADDPVPNVRLVLARELPRDSPILSELKADPDPDVAFFASRA